jgi:hypothetical protein
MSPYHAARSGGTTQGEADMAFVQIIELHSSKAKEMQALAEKWEKATQGKRTARRRVLCQDRNTPNRYFNIVFFDSYESAMENSSLPETQQPSAELAGLMDKPPTFLDLDVVDDMS